MKASLLFFTIKITTDIIRYNSNLNQKKGGCYGINFDLGSVFEDSGIDSILPCNKEYDQEVAGEVLSYM